MGLPLQRSGAVSCEDAGMSTRIYAATHQLLAFNKATLAGLGVFRPGIWGLP